MYNLYFWNTVPDPRLITLFKRSLIRQGRKFTEGPINPELINIIFVIDFTPKGWIIPENSIIMQLESLTPQNTWLNDNYITFLRKYEVWDFCQYNINVLANYNIKAKLCNISVNYLPQPRVIEKKIDVLFYGKISERRRNIYIKLIEAGIIAVFNDKLSDEEIYQSRIILNLNLNTENELLDIFKIQYLLNFGSFIVTEDSLNKDEYLNFSPQLVFCQYDSIVNTIQHYLVKGVTNVKTDTKIDLPLPQSTVNKSLVLYTFHDYTPCVDFFIRHGIIESEKYDYLIIINSDYSLKLPQRNVKIINRENLGFDFGAWSHGLDTLGIKLGMDKFPYSHYFFINSSVRGPFLPSYLDAEWPQLFIQKLTDQVKIVGTTISWIRDDFHVQSMMFVIDNIGLEIAFRHKIFQTSYYYTDKFKLIDNCEIGLSNRILKSGYNIACMQQAYRNLDFRMAQTNNEHKNPFTTKGYLEMDLHPYEVIFWKTRYIPPHIVNTYTILHNKVKFNLEPQILDDKVGSYSKRFSPKHYESLYGDLSNAKMDNSSLAAHYFSMGMYERRTFL
jgi:hypothetical protein